MKNRNNELIRIAIADDQELLRMGMKHLLAHLPNVKLIAEAGNGQELLDILAREQVDIVFMDIEMPIVNGIEASTQIKKQYPKTRIIALSSYNNQKYISQMLSCGASGYMLKSATVSEIKTAIDTVMEGNSFFSQELFTTIAGMLQQNEKPSETETFDLSSREKEVLRLLCRGHDTQEIAKVLFISPRTVEKHKANLMAKTRTQTTLQLVVFALSNKLVELHTT